MNKIWYLGNCDTCKKIINELNISLDNFEMINIKERNISKEELEEISKVTGLNYEELFSKRALKYKLIKDSLVSDDDFKKAILEEYTFLKRPFIRINSKYFIGNSKKVVEDARVELRN